MYAAGVNPNSGFNEWQATTTETTDHRTPYAALQKAVENNTVTLLTNSNTALTPTRDELLLEQSTLVYETDSKYAGNLHIHIAVSTTNWRDGSNFFYLR